MGMRWEQQKILQNMHSTSSRRWCLIPSTNISSQLQYKLTQQVSSKEQKGKEQRQKKIILLWLSLENTTLARWSRISSVQLLSRVRHFATSWNKIPCHHQLPELAQTHVHRVGDAIQPSPPLSSPSPPAFNLSKHHQGLFRWVSSLHQVAKLLELSKYWTQYASKFGKLSHGHRIGKGQFSFQSQRKAMPKNVLTTAQLHSFHTLAK